ncbi:MAG: N-acetylmuramoyl-L-alanine amidase [Candidatus Omnitrophota bacterium]
MPLFRRYLLCAVIFSLGVTASGCASRQPYTRADRGTEPVPKRKAPLQPSAESRLKTIVIDPGHGGKARGAIGPTGLKEKDVTLGIAKKLKARLEAEGYRVYLTRTRDDDVSLVRRRDMAEERNADLFVSIHCDGSKNRNPNGTAVYILSKKGADIVRNRALTSGDYIISAESLSREKEDYLNTTIVDLKMDGITKESRKFAELAETYLVKELGTKRLGVKDAAFAVLKTADVPSCLVEVAFITNWWEEKQLKKDSIQENVAKALTQAVNRYFEDG